MRLDEFKGFDNIVSSQEYAVSTINNRLLMMIYNTPSLYIESFLYSENNETKYVNNLRIKDKEKEETHTMMSDRLFTIDQYKEYLKYKDKNPITLVYSYDNCNHNEDNQFFIKIPNKYKNVDIDVCANKTDKIIKHDNFIEVVDKKFSRVNYISINEKGYFQVNTENNKLKFSNIVIKGKDIIKYETGKVLKPNEKIAEKILHLATLPDSIITFKNDFREDSLYLYYDAYGILSETSDGYFKYECYLNDQNRPTDIMSFHPLYIDQFDGSNIFNNNLWVVERLDFNNPDTIIYFRNVYKLTKDNNYKLRDFLKKEAIHIDYPILELINFEELYK